MEAFEFSKHAIALCSQHNFIRSIEIQLLDEPVVKIKAIIVQKAVLLLTMRLGLLFHPLLTYSKKKAYQKSCDF